MTVFVDASAIFALLDKDDQDHEAAQRTWATLAPPRAGLVTTNYVLVESAAISGLLIAHAASASQKSV